MKMHVEDMLHKEYKKKDFLLQTSKFVLFYFEWVSDKCVMPSQQFISYIMARTSNIQWDENEARFVLDTHA